MMKISNGDSGSSFVAMVVRDAERMLKFYQDVLGMELKFTDDADEGVTKYYLTFEGGMLKFFAPDEPPKLNTGDFLASTGYRLQTYRVTNMTELFKAFAENDVKIIEPPQPIPGGSGKWGIAADPEGNAMEFAGGG